MHKGKEARAFKCRDCQENIVGVIIHKEDGMVKSWEAQGGIVSGTLTYDEVICWPCLEQSGTVYLFDET